ncbi:membrane protease subunit HflK [Sphingomonas kyeonggiensis]|uniref:Membrane protease subunit HflK n=1 Tax=Sphingomonas kyeonggiensis TaxID=1268553 RepID=A0A7W7JY19_9SPHN|nr:protease modulator HflK [Sphingomonas kyeonggiensis]MBB4837464.1 membrane protease subunit HflK [Sphingomonas kyeonggiensis]
MANLFGWLNKAGNLQNEAPKSPWGSGSGGGNGGGGSGDGKGGSGGSGGGSGPRNPWSFPPEGRRPRSGGGGGGNGGGNGPLEDLMRRMGGGGLPVPPGGAKLWLLVVGGLLLAWMAFTSFHAIGPRERGVVTTLGRYSGTLGSGLQFTLPAPFQIVETVDVGSVRTLKFPESGANLMLTGDQNIVDLSYSVNWYISDAADYSFQIKDPTETVKDTAESAMRAVIATTTLNEAIGEGQGRISTDVQAAMQKILDEYHSGIRIQSVALTKAAAPEQVDDAFKAVQAAQQGAQGARNNANGYAQQVIAVAQGEAAEFDKIYEQYKAAPEVTRRRLYYETMEQVLARTNKTIVEAPGVTPYLPLPGIRPDAGKAQQGEQK